MNLTDRLALMGVAGMPESITPGGVLVPKHYNLWTEIEVVKHVIEQVPEVAGPPGWDIDKAPDIFIAVWLRIVQAYLGRRVDQGFEWHAWTDGSKWWCCAEIDPETKHYSEHGSDTHAMGLLVLFTARKELPQ